jgi:plastocyanin
MTFLRNLICLCLAGFASFAAAHDVEGQVILADGSAAKNAVVWLEGSEHASPLRNAMVDQRDLTFIPHVSAVTVGTTVKFPNDDNVYHNVFAEFRAKRFDLGMYPQGSSKKVKFDKPGLVALLCSVHSDMSAYIMVVDTPYFAVTDNRGKFHISGVPGETFKVHAWHESGQEYTDTVNVSGQTNLRLKLGRSR